MVDQLKIYTVEWYAKIWGTDDVIAKNEKDAKEIITNKVANTRMYDNEKGCIHIQKIKEEKIKIEIAKTC